MVNKYKCPICGKRIIDSSKNLTLYLFNSEYPDIPDGVIKCNHCKNEIAVKKETK